MEELLKKLKEFHLMLHAPDAEIPSTDIAQSYKDLRVMLMTEELKEVVAGIQNNDLENIAKELADLIYTTLGTVVAFGLQDKFPAIFDEVHASNMSKTYESGKGKAVKGNNYFEADIKKVLDN